MNKDKIIITTRTFAAQDLSPLKRLEQMGFEIIRNQLNRTLSPEESILLLKGAVGMIAGTEVLDDRIFQETPALRVISRVGTGLDNIDMEAAAKRGIRIYTTPEAPVESVAELTLALIFSLLRHIPQTHQTLCANQWRPLMGTLLSGKIVGIVGLGRIGKRFVELLQPFHAQILASEPKPDEAFIEKYRIKLVSLTHLLQQATIVTLHASASKKGSTLVGKNELSCMKREAILVNTARGILIDERALAEALETGALRGAALDVFQEEPYRGPLQKLPNVILTPHLGSYATESRTQMEKEAVENLILGLRN